MSGGDIVAILGSDNIPALSLHIVIIESPGPDCVTVGIRSHQKYVTLVRRNYIDIACYYVSATRDLNNTMANIAVILPKVVSPNFVAILIGLYQIDIGKDFTGRYYCSNNNIAAINGLFNIVTVIILRPSESPGPDRITEGVSLHLINIVGTCRRRCESGGNETSIGGLMDAAAKRLASTINVNVRPQGVRRVLGGSQQGEED